MKHNPALQVAHTILDSLGEKLTRTIVQRGAHTFADQNFYLNWRKYADNFVQQQLTRTYGSYVLDNENNCWKWNLMSEHANLWHNSNFCTFALMRIQNAIPTDLIITLPLLSTHYAATLGNGSYGPNGRNRVAKLKELHPNMLVAGEMPQGSLRIFGSTLTEIVYTAEGQIDVAKWTKLSGFMCLAAGLMLSEAGGVAVNFYGTKTTNKARSDSLIIGNQQLVQKMLYQQQYDT